MDIHYDNLLKLATKMAEKGYAPNRWDYAPADGRRLNFKVQYASGNVVTYSLPENFDLDTTTDGIISGDIEAIDFKTPFQLLGRRKRRQLQQRAGRPKRFSRTRYRRKKKRR